MGTAGSKLSAATPSGQNIIDELHGDARETSFVRGATGNLFEIDVKREDLIASDGDYVTVSKLSKLFAIHGDTSVF